MSATRLPAEFDLIARYFAPLARGCAGAEGLADDAAFIDVDPAVELVVTADALVAGVHFRPEDPPGLVARKALRVNLSDLAAKGALPLGYLLTIALPSQLDAAWVEAFCAGLAADQAEFGIVLMGGDTTSTPGPLTLSITAFGTVPRGRALKRRTARAGDAVVVSGTIGDAALGLLALGGELTTLSAAQRDTLVDRYHLPRPRTALGSLLAQSGMVHAAIDVSDGLVADLGHICETSGLGAELEAARVPLSGAARAALAAAPALRRTILGGGDDYEILFTAPPGQVATLGERAAGLGLELTAIGRMTAGSAVRVTDEAGREIALESPGFRHF